MQMPHKFKHLQCLVIIKVCGRPVAHREKLHSFKLSHGFHFPH